MWTFFDRSDDVNAALRPDAELQLVVVGDERNRWTPSATPERHFALDAEMRYRKFVRLHAIVSEGIDPLLDPNGDPCSSGSRHEIGEVELYVAEATGGARISVCQDDWSLLYQAIADGVVAKPAPCETPSHPLFRIAERTGGTCTTLNWTDDYEIELPEVPRLGPDGSDGIEQVVVAREGDSAVVASLDTATGLFTAQIPGIVAGPNQLRATMTTIDGLEASDTVTVIGVPPVASGSPPVAADDNLIVVGNTGFAMVFSNDVDPDGATLALADFTDPAHGEVACTDDGNCTYTPGPTFTGTDRFRYVVTDRVDGNATATVTVMADGDAPPAAPNLAFTLVEGESLELNLLAEAIDVEGPVTLVGFSTPARGTLDCTLASGACTYTAVDGGFTDPFSYTVQDSTGQQASGLVIIEVVALSAQLEPTSTHEDPFVVGQQHTYTLTVENRGNQDSTEFELVDYIPVGLRLVSMEGDGWTCDAEVLPQCSRTESLAPGATTPSITVTVDVLEEGIPEVLNVVAVGANFTVDRTEVVRGGDGPPPDAGPSDGDAGSPDRDAGADAAVGGDGAVGDAGMPPEDEGDGGCGCRVPGHASAGDWTPGSTAMTLFLLLIWRRRR